jgi:hypothetical protein
MSGSDHVDPKFGSAVAIPFSKANVVAGQANVDLVLAGGNTLAVMPFAGSVIGLGVQASAEVTAGKFTVKVHKEGTEFPQAGALALEIAANTDTAVTSDLKTSGQIRPGVMTFEAGDAIGVSYSSTTDIDPTNTNDLDAVLVVMFNSD